MTSKIINKNGMNVYYIKVEPGYVLQRISDGMIFGDELELGYTYYLFKDGKPVKLEKPIKELPKHYKEIEEIIEYGDMD